MELTLDIVKYIILLYIIRVMSVIFFINASLLLLLWITSWYIVDSALVYIAEIFNIKSVISVYVIAFILSLVLLYLVNGDNFKEIIQSSGL